MKFLIILIVLAIAAWFLLRSQRGKNENRAQAKPGPASDNSDSGTARGLGNDPQSSSAEKPSAARSGSLTNAPEEATDPKNTRSQASRNTESADNGRKMTGIAAAVASAAGAASLSTASPDATDTSPDPTDTSPDATDTSPDAADTSPDAADTSPDTTDTSPNATDTSPNARNEHFSTSDAGSSVQLANPGGTQVSENSPAPDKTPAGTSAPESGQQKVETTAIQPASGSTDIGAVVSNRELQSGDTLYDVREMIKILNLRDNDAARLSISKEDFARVCSGDAGTITTDLLDSVAAKLRHMLG